MGGTDSARCVGLTSVILPPAYSSPCQKGLERTAFLPVLPPEGRR